MCPLSLFVEEFLSSYFALSLQSVVTVFWHVRCWRACFLLDLWNRNQYPGCLFFSCLLFICKKIRDLFCLPLPPPRISFFTVKIINDGANLPHKVNMRCMEWGKINLLWSKALQPTCVTLLDYSKTDFGCWKIVLSGTVAKIPVPKHICKCWPRCTLQPVSPGSRGARPLPTA